MPTRRSAAAVASPPMPAPMIAIDSGLAIPVPARAVSVDGFLHFVRTASGRPKTCLLQRRAARVRRQRIEEGLHRRPLLARLHQRKIIMLFGKGNETQV